MVLALFVILAAIEIIFGYISFKRQSTFIREKARVRLLELLILTLLIVSHVIKWSFRWYGLALLLTVLGIIAGIRVLRDNQFYMIIKSRIIGRTLLKIVLIAAALTPALLFPQNYKIEPTGQYTVKSISYTWTDESRDETFTPQADHRKITVQFWYPDEEKEHMEEAENKFPLVVFSHGAFGIRTSNYSTFTELASHGYVVCSIDHTYHSFCVKEMDGTVIAYDEAFMEDVLKLSSEEDSVEKYEMTQEWLKLRDEDIIFCLNQIKKYATHTENLANRDKVFHMIDTEKIGLMGHSLGGAAAADVARQIKGISAVAVLDGTMLGDEIGFEEGKVQLATQPYPVPLLNFYNGASYKEIEKIKDAYSNTLASVSQENAYQVAIMNAGHMNFTDLPLVAPFLAKSLGTGTVNARSCIQYVNRTLLQFFDAYLKDEPIDLPEDQIISIGRN